MGLEIEEAVLEPESGASPGFSSAQWPAPAYWG